MNPVHMSVKQWYQHILEREVTMIVVDDEGRTIKKLSKVEERQPENDWDRTFHLARLRGHTPAVKSFNFKLLHKILPCKERLSQLLPSNSPQCVLCRDIQNDSLLHAFFQCENNKEAAQFLLHLIRVYDPTISENKALQLSISTDLLYELPVYYF